ncbi:hypothetical protein EDD18DRAFT_1382898 [Armillaria luteobubalina]|uniref:Heterokaryon incompatibility domain-containing protein n=1 Tax=Armillaria luteobubalina TaxID=153913 RepID=A0AA39P3J6_9AGAR|nr:hypothetical protein EDD18DRAFT_1382898 [Armillaria luteobubalina]
MVQGSTRTVRPEREFLRLTEQWSDYEDDSEYSSSEYSTDSTDEEYTDLPPKVTLTSWTETGQDELMISVFKQRSYRGRNVIPSALANTLCADLGVDGVLEELNITLGTFYFLDSVISILGPYIIQNIDFGTAYAYLRRYWNDISTIEETLRIQEAEDREMRRNILANGRITMRNVPPRRVWDLRANRVVPYWFACNKAWGISHAWVDEKDRVYVMTSINGEEWPVPMPKDANLDLIRMEMLNFGAHYAWLDVLCLRQEGGKNEHLRLEEWKLDVPTIGSVYQQQLFSRVVFYFNGLGRPLRLTPGYFESDRCWFRRAWTLQEITTNPIIGGKAGKDVMNGQVERSLNRQLASLQNMRQSTSILDILSAMKRRVSTKPLDKVAGLVYLLRTSSIPIYDTKQSPTDA